MNLWRRSKSWFQEGFSAQTKEIFEPQDFLRQEKEILNKKYERERKILSKHYYQQLLEAKLRFDMESRRLDDEHNQLKTDAARDEKENCPEDFLTLAKKTMENDGLEWDPSDDLKSYSEDEVSDSWSLQTDLSRRSSSVLSRAQFDDIESCDSAYNSLSFELQKKILPDEGTRTIGLGITSYQHTDVERKVEQLQLTIRQEVVKECEEKFRQERNFLYSIIDELEENVSLLRKQKEDIVTIFEAGDKRLQN